MKKEVLKLGRPTVYNPKIAKEICRRLSEGESLRSICKDEIMPARSVILSWALDSEHPFSAQYAIARRIQAELMIDEVRDIADDSSNDFMMTEKGLVPDYENMQRSRLRVDTRKWIACKVLPKIYGDKLQTEHSGTISLGDLIAKANEPKSD